MTSPFRLLARTIVTWAIEVAGLHLMLRQLPGVTVTRWEFAILAIAVIGLLNAMVRPGILMVAANLGIIPFLIVALALNGLLVQVASWLVPGFWVDGLLTAFMVAFGLAFLNTVATALLSIDDDDAFYRNVVRRLSQRMVAVTDETTRPGTVIMQIDGLAEPILRRALADGRMPTLASWLAAGTHHLAGWQSEIPSMTTSAQAGILHGSNGGVPAFYWYEKDGQRLMSSANPSDLHRVQHRISDGHGLLHDDGVSVTNLFSGDAARSVMTVGTLLDDGGSVQADPHDFYGYLISPYNLYRGLIGLIFEAVLETWQCLRQWVENRQPRIRRFGLFTLQRGAATVILRDATTWTVIASMYQGHRVIYCDFLGYDEVGHFAGPETPDAIATLYAIDRQIRQIALAAREAPRPYQLVVLSDHGQTTAPNFQSLYGHSLDGVVREAINAGPTLRVSGGKAEAPGYLSAFLNEIAGGSGLRGRGARRLLRTRRGSGLLDPVAEQLNRASADDVEIVVTSSGSLAHIYFAKVKERLTLEQITTAYPGLIEALVTHPGIGLVLVRSTERGSVVIGKTGIRELHPDRIAEGEDPLAQFEAHTAHFLDDLVQFDHAGDIIVNGTYDPSNHWVVGFDDLVGAHGGIGGMQTQPFIAYPTTWTDTAPEIVGSVQLHHFLREHTAGRHAERAAAVTPKLPRMRVRATR
ncbi:MAG: alkaline phosphatase family protein [Chloroflexota bacterium]